VSGDVGQAIDEGGEAGIHIGASADNDDDDDLLNVGIERLPDNARQTTVYTHR
jgi:hypothetical protein